MSGRQEGPKSTLVDDQNQISDFCVLARETGAFAYDTEFVMEDRFESEICLIQLASATTTIIIDPFLELDLTPIWELITDEAVTTVVHAGEEDLAIAYRQLNRPPRNVFDVQICAGLAGYDYPLSLQRLVRTTGGIRLHKTKTLTDWRRRPLTEAQIKYGAEDVCYLVDACQFLRKKLTKLDRMDWATQECAKFEHASFYERSDVDKVLRLKGAGSLDGKQLAVLRGLLLWRETFAKRINRPGRFILKDYLLVEIAKHGLDDPRDILELRGVSMKDRDVHDIANIVKQAKLLPPSDWPEPKKQEIDTPEDAAIVALVSAVIRSYCADAELSFSLVATQKSIRRLVRHRTKREPADVQDVELLNGWRSQTVGLVVDELLVGKRRVRIVARNGKLGVCVEVADGQP